MKTAMILAAGRGDRLKPITDTIPKAMCLVKGRPLIEVHVERLSLAGFRRIVINHAHLGDKIRHHLGDGSAWGVEICYSPEPPGGLETGGGIYYARELLGQAPFVTVNADIYTDFDFKSLQLPEGSQSHLVLGNNPAHNPQGDFSFNTQQKLSRRPPNFTFLGIAIFHPKAFIDCKPGRYSVVPLIDKLIQQQQASAEFYRGLWLDIGTEARLLEANSL